MKRKFCKFFSTALIFGIVTFPFFGILSHSFAHTFDLDHGGYVKDIGSCHSDDKGHPDVDLKNAPDGVTRTGLLKYLVGPIVLMMRNKENPFPDPHGTFYEKTDPSLSYKSSPFLRPYFSHAPPASL